MSASVFHLSKSCSYVITLAYLFFSAEGLWSGRLFLIKYKLLICPLVRQVLAGDDAEMSRWLQTQCDGGTTFFLWTSGSWGRRLSLVSSQHQTVSPHRGHEKKSRGITRECFPPRPSLLSLLLLFLTPPTPPFFLHPWCSIYCWEAFFGNGRGSGIVFRDQWQFCLESTSRVSVLFTVWSFTFTCLLPVLCSVPGTEKFLWCKL